MDPIFKKLNYKAQEKIIVLNTPDSFKPNLAAMKSYAAIKESLSGVKKIEFAIAFVMNQKQIDKHAPKILSKAVDDAIIWFCYPKKSSKNYTCDFNRDTGWQVLGDHGYEGVRMVAIDADWSALRFRQVNHIKKITRSKGMALTDEAKRRTTNKK